MIQTLYHLDKADNHHEKSEGDKKNRVVFTIIRRTAHNKLVSRLFPYTMKIMAYRFHFPILIFAIKMVLCYTRSQSIS